MNKIIISSLFSAMALVASAQSYKDVQTILLSRNAMSVSYRDTTVQVLVKANETFSVSSTDNWLLPKVNGDRVEVSIRANELPEERIGTVNVTTKDGTMTRRLEVTQAPDASVSELDMNDPALSIFADEVWSSLKPGTTQAQVDAIKNGFAHSLAQKLLDGTYDTKYRVGEYIARTNPEILAEEWYVPGKSYDRIDGVTGINVPAKTKIGVLVSGIPQARTVELKLVAWYVGKEGTSFDGGDPSLTTYTLRNGINVIDYQGDYDALAYVTYFVGTDPSKLAPVKVHFVNGSQNGYLSPDKTNEEMLELCKNAKNICMDLWGSKVHSVWTAAGLRDYCKASDGTSLGYRQYMNLLDSLVQWEHDLLGFTKYNRVPTYNHTFAYTNYTYYMFQGWWGVSFIHTQEPRVLNCRTLMYNDNDAIWGLSHEWGHQHQMHPYFCWAGMTEVTNNMNSYYNLMHMGYDQSDKIEHWPRARNHFIADADYNDGKHISGWRKSLYEWFVQNSSAYSYAPKMQALCRSMSDNVIKAYSDQPTKAVAIQEVQNKNADGTYDYNSQAVGETLAPLIMIYNYATYDLGLKDFGPDFFESLRQMEQEGGSTIEKKDGYDKYELIAMAQNSNVNGAYAKLAAAYPSSCWVTDGYLNNGNVSWQDNSAPYHLNFVRKVSRLTGYNLWPVFEKWGFLRIIAMRIGDYGNKNYVLTQEMYDEFKADMDALVADGTLKETTSAIRSAMYQFKDINQPGNHRFNTPEIPN